MKKLLLILPILCGCGLFSSKPSTAAVKQKMVTPEARGTEGVRKRVVVLPFLDSDVSRSEKVSKGARSAFVRALSSTNQVVVIDLQDLPKDTATFKKNEEYDMEAISQMAANAGASAVIEGKVMEVLAKKIGDEVGLFRKVKAKMTATVRLRMFSSKNGREIMNDMRTATIEDITTVMGSEQKKLEEDPKLLSDTVNKAFKGTIGSIAKNIDKIIWEGRIAMISGSRIFINSGRISGLQVGDILRVTEDGDDVFDPDSGVFIGKAPGHTKGTIEVVSYFGKDGSIAVVHSGSGFQENDKIELY